MSAQRVSRFASNRGVRLRFVEHGEGEPVVLLHGFPDTRRSFDLQLPALAMAGLKAVTPDLRGYGDSDKPRAGYDLDTLAADVVAIIDELGSESVRVVGHDWGGAITWQLLTRHPKRVKSAVILNAPHPAIFAGALRSNPRQIRRSWYFFYFQLPRLPEHWLTRDHGRNVGRMFRSGSRGRDRVPADIVDAAREQLCRPGHATPAVAYYREAVRGGLSPSRVKQALDVYRSSSIDVPTTIIWGVEDGCLGEELLDGVDRYVVAPIVHRIEDAGHFVHQERPERVNPLLVEALGERAADELSRPRIA